jgi:hypothetical protein
MISSSPTPPSVGRDWPQFCWLFCWLGEISPPNSSRVKLMASLSVNPVGMGFESWVPSGMNTTTKLSRTPIVSLPFKLFHLFNSPSISLDLLWCAPIPE